MNILSAVQILHLFYFYYIIKLGDDMKKTIKDYQYKDKTVIIRCDLNVPIKNNEIEDDTRINETI